MVILKKTLVQKLLNLGLKKIKKEPLSFIEKIKLIFYLIQNKITEIYILTPKKLKNLQFPR